MNVIEDLGIINYIFSDKTGTLTSNTMKFRGAVIGNSLFKSKDLSKHFSNRKFSDS